MRKLLFVLVGFAVGITNLHAFTLNPLVVSVDQVFQLMARQKVPGPSGWYAYNSSLALNHSKPIPPNSAYVENRLGTLNALLIISNEVLDPTSISASTLQLAACNSDGQNLVPQIPFTIRPTFSNRALSISFQHSLPDLTKWRVTVSNLRTRDGRTLPSQARTIYNLIGDVNADLVVDARDESSIVGAMQVCALAPALCNLINPNDPTSGYLYHYDVVPNFILNGADRGLVSDRVNQGSGIGLGLDMRGLNCP